MIDAVVGLATPVLPLLAWMVPATCTKITGIRFGGNNTGWINTKSTRHIVRTTAHLNAKKYYNTNSILFCVVGRGALHSVEYLNFMILVCWVVAKRSSRRKDHLEWPVTSSTSLAVLFAQHASAG